METEERTEPGRSSGDSTPRGVGVKPMPLNSRRVTGLILRSVAASLGLPTSAPVEDLRQMIDEELAEQGREPRDVQLVVETAETEAPGRVLLYDGEGAFLDAELLTAEPVGGSVLAG